MFKIFTVGQVVLDILNKSQTLKPIPYDQDENFLVAHPMSKGGMVMFSKKAFLDCNGYNCKHSDFVCGNTWGQELENYIKSWTL